MAAERPDEGAFAPMREQYPDLCWRLLPGDRCCIRDRGHDNGAHEDKPSGTNVRVGTEREAKLEAALYKIAESYPWEPFEDEETISRPHEALVGAWYDTGEPTNHRVAREALDA